MMLKLLLLCAFMHIAFAQRGRGREGKPCITFKDEAGVCRRERRCRNDLQDDRPLCPGSCGRRRNRGCPRGRRRRPRPGKVCCPKDATSTTRRPPGTFPSTRPPPPPPSPFPTTRTPPPITALPPGFPFTTTKRTTTSGPVRDYFKKFEKQCGLVSRVSSKPALARVIRSAMPQSPGLPTLFIVGGQDAQRNAWPWMTLLGDGTRWSCGGALISDRHILTAAHCCTSVSNPSVARLGEHDLSQSSESPHRDFSVISCETHPGYNPPSVTNDIALVTLSSTVPFSNYIRPVCMPNGSFRPDRVNVRGTIIGWGTTRFAGAQSNILQEVSVPVVDKKDCENAYRSLGQFDSLYPGGFPEELFCASEKEGGKDACQGDSGGPFMVKQNNKYTIEGIVSAGNGCGLADFPGIYTFVNPYTNWILSQVNRL